MSKYPDNDGKEAIEMADLSAPSPAGGLYFDYDFDDYGEAVERKKGSRDGKNKMPWIKWRDHTTLFSNRLCTPRGHALSE